MKGCFWGLARCQPPLPGDAAASWKESIGVKAMRLRRCMQCSDFSAEHWPPARCPPPLPAGAAEYISHLLLMNLQLKLRRTV